jgi:lysyl-tRNA synthetase class II
MPKLAQKTQTTIQEFVSKFEEFINAEETIRAFTKQAERAKMTNKLKDPPQAEGSGGENRP